MEIVVAIFILGVLVVILLMLCIDEKRLKTSKSSQGTVTGYWHGSEKRASVRIKTIIKATYSVDDKLNEKKNTISKNISLGGMLMQLYEKLAPTTLLLLDIFLPNEQSPIAAKGEVVWIRELADLDNLGRRIFDAGIKFISMAPKDKERLDRQIKGLIELQHG